MGQTQNKRGDLSPRDIKKIEEILNAVRPYIEMHGGNVVLSRIQGNTVTLKIFGVCIGCPLTPLTYDKMIGGLIKQEIRRVKKVEIEE